MGFLDSILSGGVERQRKLADEAARKQFNPDVVLPMLQDAQRRADRGIEEDDIRANAVSNILDVNSVNADQLPLGSGRSLAFLDRLSEQKTSSVADLEQQLAIEEERAREEGRMQAANIMSKRREIIAQRGAKIAENRAIAEAESQARKGKFLGSIASFALSAVGGAPGIGKMLNIAPKENSFVDQLNEFRVSRFIKGTPSTTVEGMGGADFLFEDETKTTQPLFG